MLACEHLCVVSPLEALGAQQHVASLTTWRGAALMERDGRGLPLHGRTATDAPTRSSWLSMKRRAREDGTSLANFRESSLVRALLIRHGTTCVTFKHTLPLPHTPKPPSLSRLPP